MDANECQTLIAAARQSAGCSLPEVLERLDEAGQEFKKAVRRRFKRKGEW